jgi:type I restriction enzyme S subunit
MGSTETVYDLFSGLSSDNWNLKFEIFADLEFAVPCADEQKKIVCFFTLLDQQIQVEKDKLEAIKNVKKGLLQQMFV